MKLSAFMIIIGCLQVSAASYAQININEKNVSLNVVFKDIQRQTNFTFFYQVEDLNEAKNVSILIKDGSINTVMNATLKGQGLFYSIIGNTIVVSKAKSPPYSNTSPTSDTVEFRGRVLDEHNKPLEGVSVIVLLKQGNATFITNADGTFIFSKLLRGSHVRGKLYRLFDKRFESWPRIY